MQVLKFGGSSVANATRISAVLDIVTSKLPSDRMILVCSAIRGCTDALIAMGECHDPQLRAQSASEIREKHARIIQRLFTGEERTGALKELDKTMEELLASRPCDYVTFGEILSTRIIARKCLCEGIPTKWADSRMLVRTLEDGSLDEKFTYQAIHDYAAANAGARLFVAPGFIATGADGLPTTLGRGGSDYTAAIYAAATNATNFEIWTDVPGIMTANPKTVPAARTIDYISYEAAFCLAEAGAKVLYAPTVKPAMQAGIPFRILDSYNPSHPGTVVGEMRQSRTERWMGVSSYHDSEPETAVIALVGEGICGRRNAVARIVTAMGDAGVSALSDVWGEGSAFYVRVRATIENEALAAIHREFFESATLTELPVFIAGYGAVGHSLVALIEQGRDRVAARLGRSIKIVGVANSRHYVIDMRGLQGAGLESALAGGKSSEGGAYIDAVIASASKKAIFVDCTDDPDIHARYGSLFRAGINVVTSNRRSLALPYVQYAALKTAARENGCFFRYDTTVGNAIPILEYLAAGANCSDSIESIEAVVSCTMNYVITGYDGPRTDALALLLEKAQREGLTEKDPRTDLAGRDVLRKLLILARESGVHLEESDVVVKPMLPAEFFDCSLDEFYRRLKDYEPRFQSREDELDAMGVRQRFVASLKRDPSARLGFRAEISMQLVNETSPFFRISGTENVIVVRSEHSSPLVIKGSGEGVRLAATGIIRDILL